MAKIRVARLCCLLAMAIPSIGLAQRGHLPGEIPLDHYPAFAVSELDDVESFVENLFQWQHQRLQERFHDHQGDLPAGIVRETESGLKVIGREAPQFLMLGFQLNLIATEDPGYRDTTKKEMILRGLGNTDTGLLFVDGPEKAHSAFINGATLGLVDQFLEKAAGGTMPSDAWIKSYLEGMQAARNVGDRAFSRWYLGRFSNHGRRVLLSYIYEKFSSHTSQFWNLHPAGDLDEMRGIFQTHCQDWLKKADEIEEIRLTIPKKKTGNGN